MNVEYWWNCNKHGKTEVLEEKFDPVPFRPPQISRGLSMERNRASAVRSRRLLHELSDTALNRLCFTRNYNQSSCCKTRRQYSGNLEELTGIRKYIPSLFVVHKCRKIRKWDEFLQQASPCSDCGTIPLACQLLPLDTISILEGHRGTTILGDCTLFLVRFEVISAVL